MDAKEKELENMKENNVYELEEYKGQATISSRWIITEKYKEGKKVVKARLVARGFEEDSDKLRTDSPTCSRISFRLLIAVAASKSWRLNSIDISSAFLQGDKLDRALYLKPPLDVCKSNEV